MSQFVNPSDKRLGKGTRKESKKGPEVNPVLDHPKDEVPRPDEALRVAELANFDNCIRNLKVGSFAVAKQLHDEAKDCIEKLGLECNGRAVRRTPKGSDQFSAQGVVKWMRGVKVDQEEAVKQLKCIQATAAARCE